MDLTHTFWDFNSCGNFNKFYFYNCTLQTTLDQILASTSSDNHYSTITQHFYITQPWIWGQVRDRYSPRARVWTILETGLNQACFLNYKWCIGLHLKYSLFMLGGSQPQWQNRYPAPGPGYGPGPPPPGERNWVPPPGSPSGPQRPPGPPGSQWSSDRTSYYGPTGGPGAYGVMGKSPMRPPYRGDVRGSGPMGPQRPVRPLRVNL